MANQEHLDKQWRFVYNLIDKLLEGVSTWNKWREDNPGVTPDLRFASLAGANLIGANLTGANLSFAFLRFADLSGARLIGADLFKVIYDSDTQWPRGWTDEMLSDMGAINIDKEVITP